MRPVSLIEFVEEGELDGVLDQVQPDLLQQRFKPLIMEYYSVIRRF